MLTAASPLLRPWHTMSRPKRNSRLDSSASWDERARTPLIYFPLNHPLWRGDTLKGAIRWDGTGCGGGWNGSRPWVRGMGARGARGGSGHDAGWVFHQKSDECSQTNNDLQTVDCLIRTRLPGSQGPKVSLTPR